MSFKEIQLEDIGRYHPVSVLASRWPDLSGGESIAPWSAFRPFDFPKLLPWMMVLKQEEQGDPAFLRYTICGDGCQQTFGFSYRGKIFGEDLPDDAIRERLVEFSHVRSGKGPVYSSATLPIEERSSIRVFRGTFGFSNEAGQVDRIMVILAPVTVEVRENPFWREQMYNAQQKRRAY